MDHLHALIHALSRTEKRYFKRYALSQVGEENSKYLELFDRVAKQPVYDAEALIRTLALSGGKSTLAARKSYLYRLILKSLRAYNAKTQVTLQLKGLLSDVRTLYNKTLFQQCQKVIGRAKKLAKANEDFAALLEINVWERKLMKVSMHRTKYEAAKGLIEEKDALLEQLGHFFRAYDRFDIEFISQEENETPFSGQLELPFREGTDFHATRLHLQAESLAAVQGNDISLALRKTQEALDLWENDRRMIKAHRNAYRVQIYNMLHLLALEGRYTQFPKWFQKLDLEGVKDEREHLSENQNRYLYELVYQLNAPGSPIGKPQLKEIEQWLEKSREKIPYSRLLIFQTNLGIVYFIHQNYSKARKWNDRLLLAGRSGVRSDLQVWGRGLDLILCFEQGLDDMLGYRMRSAERFFRSWQDVPGFARLILETFKGILKFQSTSKFKPHLRHMHAKIQALTSLPDAIPGHLEFLLWIQSVVLETPIQILLRRGGNEADHI
ncbi:MAG: hypothetical protein AAF570_11785 [Bacteroidota bacterium]